MPRKRSGPAVSDRTHSTPPSDNANSTHGSDIELDLTLVGANADIWAALFAGEFKLAVPCSRCGRWLVNNDSKRAGIGAHCAAQADR
jgi:hypothetical protein